jgi:hypothetical protein
MKYQFLQYQLLLLLPNWVLFICIVAIFVKRSDQIIANALSVNWKRAEERVYAEKVYNPHV